MGLKLLGTYITTVKHLNQEEKYLFVLHFKCRSSVCVVHIME